ALYAHQAWQASGSVFYLAAAIPRHRLLPGRGGNRAARCGPYRVCLRPGAAAAAAAGKRAYPAAAGAVALDRARARRFAVGSPVHVVCAECPQAVAGRRAAPPEGALRWPYARSYPVAMDLPGPPPVARSQCLSGRAMRRNCCADTGWPRGARQHQLWGVSRWPLYPVEAGRASALAGTAVRRRHPISGLSAFIGRIQGDGPGFLRAARIPVADARNRAPGRRGRLPDRTPAPARALRPAPAARRAL